MLQILMRQKIFAGPKIRQLREANALNQVAFAERLGISASYLNQIESNQRPLTAQVMVALAQTFSIDVGAFAHEDTEKVMSDLKEALADPVFGGLSPNGQDLKTIINNVPWFAHAFLGLHVAFRRTGERLHALDEVYTSGGQEGDRTPGVLMPYEEVRDFLHYRSNYFEGLDQAAEDLAEQTFGSVAARPDTLANYLFNKHAIRIELRGIEPNSRFMRQYDRKARVLWLREGIDPSSATFLMAQQIGLLEQGDEIERIVAAAGFRTEDAAAITRLALANYFAGAVLMPYDRFLEAARRTRYDAERLCFIFGTSFEQVGHRFSTLQKPNAKGVPFYFVRFDRAGNIIKRHSSTRFQFARFGGTCPLWNVHEAFEAAGRTLVQIAEMPDGVRYVCVARAVTKSGGSHLAPPRHYALGIGCELIHASEVVYADALDIKTTPVTLIGVSCRMCERHECPQRAAPPIDRTLTVDPDRRDFVPFRFA
jgi:predicted transcriptional regulator/transcriptional regulator with XRE-family HTH domain